MAQAVELDFRFSSIASRMIFVRREEEVFMESADVVKRGEGVFTESADVVVGVVTVPPVMVGEVCVDIFMTIVLSQLDSCNSIVDLRTYCHWSYYSHSSMILDNDISHVG